MEPNIIVKHRGIIITCKGRTIVVSDMQGETDHMAAVIFDKVVFEELQAMARMAVHMVANMPGDRAYTVAVFLSNLFGGYVRDITVQLGGYAPGETETRR